MPLSGIAFRKNSKSIISISESILSTKSFLQKSTPKLIPWPILQASALTTVAIRTFLSNGIEARVIRSSEPKSTITISVIISNFNQLLTTSASHLNLKFAA
jgi:hypothetical protein